MAYSIRPAATPQEMLQFVKLPWKIYKNDPCWVPPLIEDTLHKLDPEKNKYWRTASRHCWIAYDGSVPVGRICAIADAQTAKYVDPTIGRFGFFECENDPKIAALLFDTAADWLLERGYSKMRGPYNPSNTDEIGIQVEGFDHRPVMLAAHTPPYYQDLFNSCGLVMFNDIVARLYRIEKGKPFEEMIPAKFTKVAELAEKRQDIKIRPMRSNQWEEEVRLACDIYNRALSPLPGFIPIPPGEFLDFANGFKAIVDPKMALLAQVNGQSVGFALALPDVNQALQKANGKLDLPGTLRFLIEMQKLERVSFKIMMILPEYQARGIEVLLARQIGKRIIEKGYKEVDMSLAGDENVKSNRFQSNLGFKVYLRYYVYEKQIGEMG